jgi:hypothetical protein
MTPLKAEYIGADQLPSFVFRLQLFGGPYIPIIPARIIGMRARRSLKTDTSTASVSLTAPKDGSRLSSTRNDYNTHTPGPDHPIRPLLDFNYWAYTKPYQTLSEFGSGCDTNMCYVFGSLFHAGAS